MYQIISIEKMIVKEFNIESNTYFGIECDKKIFSKKSQFQKIDVYYSKFFGNILMLDQCFMVSQKNSEGYHLKCLELFDDKKKKNVCIIGGGDFGLVHHILKNKIAYNIDLIEIDKDVIDVSKKYFNHYFKYVNDNNVNIIIEDGVKWIKKRKGSKYDAIIIDSTDPNKISKMLFTKSFYRLVYNNLKSKGIFIQQSGSPVLHGKKIIYPTIKKLNEIKFTNITCHNLSMPLYPLGVWSFIKCVKA